MPAEVQLLAGPARCGKAQRLLNHYRRTLLGKPNSTDATATEAPATYAPAIDRCCWLAPNRVALTQIQDQLLENSAQAFLAPNLYTFSAFADTLITRSQRRIRPVARLQKRRLLQHVIRETLEQGDINHFAQVAHTPGFAIQVDEFIAELKRADVWPDLFQRWAAKREDRQPLEMATLYTAYQRALHRGELYDAEGRFWAAREILDNQPSASHQEYDLLIVHGFNDFTTAQYDILRLLSQRCSQLIISLTVELPDHDDEGRSLLFAKTNQTLARLQQVFPQLQVHREPSPSPAPHSLQQFQQQLFCESPEESQQPATPKKSTDSKSSPPTVP